MKPDIKDDPDDLSIDPDDLPREWIRQPRLMRTAGRAEADAQHDHSEAKAFLSMTEARLRLAVHNNPEAFSLKKATEATVDAAVKMHPDYQKALQDVINCKYAVDVYSGHTTSLVDRRKALENTVELLALEYHCEREPKTHSAKGYEELEQRSRRSAREE